MPIPTPCLNFLIGKYKLAGGIILTASHNPKEYNGYKTYNYSGEMMTEEETNLIENWINSHPLNLTLETRGRPKLVKVLNFEAERNYYFKEIEKTFRIKKGEKNLSITYSNLHGAGKGWTDKLLERSGFKIYPVAEQFDFDGRFPTLEQAPNPEYLSSWNLAFKRAKETNSELIFLNDADADRFRAAEANHPHPLENKGRCSRNDCFTLFSANEIGGIIVDYLAHQLSREERERSSVVTTLVSGDLPIRIAKEYGLITSSQAHVGFKNLTKLNKLFAKKGINPIFSYEESYGFLPGGSSLIKEKDGVQTALLFAATANYYRTHFHNKLTQVVKNLKDKYGEFHTETFNIFLSLGEMVNLPQVMDFIRNNPLTLKNHRVINKEDYLIREPKGDLVKLYFSENEWIGIRPSGTEPKLKLSVNLKSENLFLVKEIKQILLKKLRE